MGSSGLYFSYTDNDRKENLKSQREGAESQRKWISYSNTWCERKKCVSHWPPCVFHSYSLQLPSQHPYPVPIYTPCRLKCANLLAWEIGSRVFGRKNVSGLDLWSLNSTDPAQNTLSNDRYTAEIIWRNQINTELIKSTLKKSRVH